MKSPFRFCILLLVALPLRSPLAAETPPDVQPRPFIWAKQSERARIIEKIHNEPWAKALLEDLRGRANTAVTQHKRNPDKYLKGMPLDWQDGKKAPPRLYTILDDGPGSAGADSRKRLNNFVQDGVDCGVMYFLSGDEAYARCAADILTVVVEALTRMTPAGTPFNGGWIYPEDHLKESRIFGAQFPLIYDFIYPYIIKGGTVHDLASGRKVSFPFDKAQTIFRTYVKLALETGIIEANWPVLESPSLVHNILALDNPKERAVLLPYYLELRTRHQDSLAYVASKYEKPGDMWPESLNYSNAVTRFSVYLMTLLDRLYPDLHLGARYSRIPAALGANTDLLYPDMRDLISFGDGNRPYSPPYFYYEIAYLLADLNGNAEQLEQFGSLINSGLASGEYKRSKITPRENKPEPYFTPLELLWPRERHVGQVSSYKQDRTNSLPFAGIYIQRNLDGTDQAKDGLMAFVGGGHYVHGHASGMNIELYGKGEVLGVDGGKGDYRSDIHENYYRLFAAHNTVVSNGASASQGGWVNLGINQLELVAMEPMPRADAVSRNYSFSTTRFFDEFNLVAPAWHERTLAVIRTSDRTGYYVDVFRARSESEGAFHDYIYHNIGDSLELRTASGPLPLGGDDGRFAASASLPWKLNESYRHPGWHFFEDVRISAPLEQPVQGDFRAAKAGEAGLGMYLFMNGGEGRSYASVKAPPCKLATVKAYQTKPVPALVARQPGNAWKNPFVAVFEPYAGEADSRSVQDMETISVDGEFRGLVVRSLVDSKVLKQVILLHEDDTTREYPQWGLSFSGRFALVTCDEQGQPLDAYVGDGRQLRIGDRLVEPESKNRSIAWTRD